MKSLSFDDLARVMEECKYKPLAPPRVDENGNRRDTMIEDIIDAANTGANVYFASDLKDGEMHTRFCELYPGCVFVSPWIPAGKMFAMHPVNLLEREGQEK